MPESLKSATMRKEISILEDAIISIKKELAISKANEMNFNLEILGDRLVVMSDSLSRHGWSVTAYIGFALKKDAMAMVERLTKSVYECKKTDKPAPFLFMELGETHRTFEGKYELKVIDLHQSLINKLCKEFGYAIRNNAPLEIPIAEPQKPLSQEEIEEMSELIAISQKATIN